MTSAPLCPRVARVVPAAQERASRTHRTCPRLKQRTDSGDLEWLSQAASPAGGCLCRWAPTRWLEQARMRLAAWLGLGHARRTSLRVALLVNTVLLLVLVLALAGLAMGAAIGWYYASVGWDDAMPAGLVDAAGQPAKYTLVFMSHVARRRTLRMAVEHYSKCPSAEEVVVVWNDGPPPDVESEFRSVVPVRLRVEAANRLSNRFLPDSLLRTRAVLMLDDDTLMRCSDVERGFVRWLEQPQALVGFFPRIVRSELPGFGERRVFKLRQYNVILTGAAFIDSEHLFPLYWSEEYQEARQYVEDHFNCEDLLMNHVVARAAAPGAPAVQYVRPRRRLDISWLSRVGISRAKVFAAERRACAAHFSQLLGGSALRDQQIEWDGDERPPWCSFFGCLFL